MTAPKTNRFSPFELPIDAPCPASLLYHLDSSLTPDWQSPLTADEVAALTLDVNACRRYPNAPAIALPPPLDVHGSLETAIRQRRTAETFSPQPMTLAEVATVLGIACGVTRDGQLPLRAAPSAGGLYAVDVYALAFNVDDLSPAVYHYVAVEHALVFARQIRGVIDMWGCLPPGWHGDTPALAVVLVARLPRVQAKYRERGYRFVLQESGHLAQNLALTSTVLGLATTGIGGFFDDSMNALIGVDGEQEVALYAILLGPQLVTPSHP